ncbi:MAG: LuxR C-terminal-related transcriptional regulator [Pyrinomonadaceae bacterium]
MRKREIKTIVESTADPAFAVNGMHNIEFWNQAAEKFFGLRSEKAVGRTCSSIIEGYDECGKFCSHDCPILVATSDRRAVRNFDLRVNTHEGKRWCNISILVVQEEKAVSPHTIHIVRPVDVSKRLEVLLRDFVVNETSLPAEQAKELTSTKRAPTRETRLSEREVGVLRLLAKGMTTKNIAEQLFISRTTVNNHVQHILKKLNAHTRLEAVRRAESAGLI